MNTQYVGDRFSRNTMLYGVYGCLLYLLMIWSPLAYSQYCDPTIHAGGDTELHYQERGNRCEGFHAYHPVGKSLEVVTVLQGNLHFKPVAEEILTVSSPIITAQTINILARSLPKPGYRMTSRLEPGESLTWPVQSVIYPGQLLAHHIGILGWFTDGHDTVYIPISVLPAHGDISDSQPTSQDIQLGLQTSGDVLEVVKWRSSEEVDGQCLELREHPWQDVSMASEHNWQPFHILLPSSSTGRLCVEIVAKSQRTGDWSRKLLRVVVRTTTPMP